MGTKRIQFHKNFGTGTEQTISLADSAPAYGAMNFSIPSLSLGAMGGADVSKVETLFTARDENATPLYPGNMVDWEIGGTFSMSLSGFYFDRGWPSLLNNIVSAYASALFLKTSHEDVIDPERPNPARFNLREVYHKHVNLAMVWARLYVKQTTERGPYEWRVIKQVCWDFFPRCVWGSYQDGEAVVAESKTFYPLASPPTLPLSLAVNFKLEHSAPAMKNTSANLKLQGQSSQITPYYRIDVNGDIDRTSPVTVRYGEGGEAVPSGKWRLLRKEKSVLFNEPWEPRDYIPDLNYEGRGWPYTADFSYLAGTDVRTLGMTVTGDIAGTKSGTYQPGVAVTYYTRYGRRNGRVHDIPYDQFDRVYARVARYANLGDIAPDTPHPWAASASLTGGYVKTFLNA